MTPSIEIKQKGLSACMYGLRLVFRHQAIYQHHQIRWPECGQQNNKTTATRENEKTRKYIYMSSNWKSSQIYCGDPMAFTQSIKIKPNFMWKVNVEREKVDVYQCLKSTISESIDRLVEVQRIVSVFRCYPFIIWLQRKNPLFCVTLHLHFFSSS